MKKIKFLGSNCTTVIEGDIEGAYDNVDHDILANILRKRISDERFIDFLKSGFKSGILDQGKNYDTLTGVPQGGIASPILFNIYMQEFDEYINHELQKDLDFLNDFQKRSTRPMNKEYNKVENRLNYVRRKYRQWKNKRKYIELNETEKVIDQKYRDEMKMLIKKRTKLPSILPHKRSLRIVYVRYADDWIIMTNGTKDLGEYLKDEIKEWLLKNLKLNLSPTKTNKTKITNIRSTPALFIGFSLKTYIKYKYVKSAYGELSRRAGLPIIIDVDQQRILDLDRRLHPLPLTPKGQRSSP